MARRALTLGLLGGLLGTLLVAPAASAAPGVRLLGERIVPNGLTFRGTTVGGLSSIDYDPRTGGYAMICDDRSEKQPARFYTARFPVTERGIGPVEFTGTAPLRRPDGKTYPALEDNDPNLPQNEQTIDPEELRVDPWTGNYVWSQEGERTADTRIDPSLRLADRSGNYLRDLPIPDNERMRPDRGPRQNLGIEGISYAGSGSLVLTSVEAPELQDGPEANTEHGALTRLTLQSRSGPVLAQFAYPEEKVFAAPKPSSGFATTGISSVLAVDPADPSRFLVMERSFVTGVGNKIRIFAIDTAGATNVLHEPSLGAARHLVPVRKHLLADLSEFPLSTVDNVEGMTWGPKLPSGERSLILVSDDNFADTQVTQLIALAVR
ncbi:esterase-like activity of phytase family protein [Sciscionella sediminilitoris]|uniref:esterase-like activity of phytase family protein n=1 Tax=Sciscionella sediminilitoris TaxID=1445613 RepID=UPI0004DF148E|nr:esterase-like activity of phytase family protein [Sciscionella sp. SE31]